MLKPEHPRDPEFQDALRALRPDCLPGGRLRRPAAAVGARHPAARLGQPALLGAARLARRRARCSTRCGPVTRSPGRRRSGSSGARRRPDVRRDDRADPPDDTAGDLLATARRGRRRPAGATLDGIEDGELEAREQPDRGASASPPRSWSTTPGSTGATRPSAIDRRVRACTPGARARGHLRRGADQDRPGRPSPPTATAARPGRARGHQERRLRRHRRPRRSGSARSSRSARSRWPRPTGRAGVRLESGVRLGDEGRP